MNPYLILLGKYGPAILKIIQTDAPTFEALLKDLQAIHAGQAPSAVVPPIQTLAAPKGFPTT